MANPYHASNPRRMIVFMIIIGIHVLFYMALKGGLARAGLQLVQETIMDLPPPPPPPPPDTKEPPPPPPTDLPPPVVPPPLIDLAPDTGPSNAIANVEIREQAARPAAPVAAQRQVVRTAPSFKTKPSQMSNIINTCYPSASRRLNEEGRVLVDIVVGADGKVSNATVAQSSGFERLDEAVINCIVRKLVFNPGTVDGVPQNGTSARIPIVYKLE